MKDQIYKKKQFKYKINKKIKKTMSKYQYKKMNNN